MIFIKEVEFFLKEQRETPFEPPKEEQEDWMISDETLEKQVFAFNEYSINFFKGAFY
jgi:hypothetical protein